MIYPRPSCCTGLTLSFVGTVKYAGNGRHLAFWAETDPSKIILWGKTLLIFELFYPPACTLPRLSILAMYMRIFITKGYRIAVYLLASTMVTFYVTTIFLSFLKCRPLAYSWDKSIPGGHCMNINEVYRWINLPNILTDVAILVLPLPVIWGLHASKDQKVGLTVTFLTGSM